MIKLLIEDDAYEYEPGRLMLSEATAIEEDWGLSPGRFDAELSSGDPSTRAIGAVVWLVKVRAIAAAGGLSFRDAAKQLPVATFDVNLAAVRPETEPEPANPTPPATRSPATSTTRRASGAKRPKTS